MFDVLWSILSHPSALAAPGGAGPFLIMVFAVIGITTAFMATIGERLRLMIPSFAVIAGTAFIPILITAFFLIALPSYVTGQLTLVTTGSLLVSALLMIILVLPVTLSTSIVYALLRGRSAGR